MKQMFRMFKVKRLAKKLKKNIAKLEQSPYFGTTTIEDKVDSIVLALEHYADMRLVFRGKSDATK